MVKNAVRLLVVVGALALVPLAPTSASAAIVNCSVSPADQAIDAEEQQMLTLVNNYRTANGRSPLRFRFGATRAAAWMSRDMATRDFLPLNHVDSLGRTFTTRLTECGVRAVVGYENIAWREPNPTAQQIFDDWRTSPVHNEIMLRSDVTHIGIARAQVPGTSRWYWTQVLITPAEPTEADFNDDGATDIAVFRPEGGVWFFRGGPTVSWGTNTDIPVPADYDGDGDTDFAVFRPAAGVWFIQGGATVGWGTQGDIPVPADYDGDGDDDIAVFRPSTGVWFVRNGPTVAWGTQGDIPVPGDYDDDGTTDIAVFRAGTWYLRNVVGLEPAIVWGTGGDQPLPLPSAIYEFFF